MGESTWKTPKIFLSWERKEKPPTELGTAWELGKRKAIITSVDVNKLTEYLLQKPLPSKMQFLLPTAVFSLPRAILGSAASIPSSPDTVTAV